MPEQVSVVGFDDIPEAGYLIPALTTVRQDFEELGRRCLSQLRALLGDSPLPADTLIAPELVVRRSTAQAPRG